MDHHTPRRLEQNAIKAVLGRRPTRRKGAIMSGPLTDFRRDMERRALRPSSIAKRMSLLLTAQAQMATPILEASTEQIVDWLDRKKICPRTRYTYTSHLAAFYHWAVNEGLTEHDPTMRIARPKVRMGLPRPLSADDVLYAIDNAVDPVVRAMVVLAAYCGLRCLEIVSLDSTDVLVHNEPPSIFVANGKGGRQRIVPANDVVLAAIRRLHAPAYGPLFPYNGRQRMPAWKASQIMRSHLHACGIPASGHQLRHTYATEVYRRSGGDLRMTQELLGHSSPSTTSIYAAYAQDRAAEVVAALYHHAA